MNDNSNDLTEKLTAAEIMRTGRGLLAGFDPTYGPDRTRAFVADLAELFDTEPPAPVTRTASVSAAMGGGPLVIGGVDFSEQMKPSEVARRFRVDPKSVTRWSDEGKLTAIRTPGGHRRYSRAQVEALLAGESA